MRFLHLIVAIIFIVFAAVQWNDPDPAFWIIIYLGVAVSAIGVFSHKHFQILALIGMITCLVGGALILPDFISWLQDGMPSIVDSMKAESLYIELVREFLGYIIAGVAYLLYFRQSLKAGCSC